MRCSCLSNKNLPGECTKKARLTGINKTLAADKISHSQAAEGVLCEAVVDIGDCNGAHLPCWQMHPQPCPCITIMDALDTAVFAHRLLSSVLVSSEGEKGQAQLCKQLAWYKADVITLIQSNTRSAKQAAAAAQYLKGPVLTNGQITKPESSLARQHAHTDSISASSAIRGLISAMRHQANHRPWGLYATWGAAPEIEVICALTMEPSAGAAGALGAALGFLVVKSRKCFFCSTCGVTRMRLSLSLVRQQSCIGQQYFHLAVQWSSAMTLLRLRELLDCHQKILGSKVLASTILQQQYFGNYPGKCMPCRGFSMLLNCVWPQFSILQASLLSPLYIFWTYLVICELPKLSANTCIWYAYHPKVWATSAGYILQWVSVGKLHTFRT